MVERSCSCRGPGFYFQHFDGSSQPFITSRRSDVVLLLLQVPGTYVVHIHMCRQIE